VLHLDDHELLGTLVGEAVLGSLGHVDRLPGSGRRDLVVDGAGRDAEDDHPVLRAVVVGLVGQPAARVHVDPLDLVAVVHIDDVPRPPRPLF
jgi:hypothetical protein